MADAIAILTRKGHNSVRTTESFACVNETVSEQWVAENVFRFAEVKKNVKTFTR